MESQSNSVKSSGRGDRKMNRAASKDGSRKSINKGSLKRTSIKSQNDTKRNDDEHKDLSEDDPHEEAIKKRVYEQVMFERRVLLACTIAVGLGTVLWIIAIAAPYWFTISGGEGVYVKKTGRYFTYSHAGIFYSCRYAFSNRTKHGFTMTELFTMLDTSNNTPNNTYNATHVTVTGDSINYTLTYNATHVFDANTNFTQTKQDLIDLLNNSTQNADLTQTHITINSLTKKNVTHYKMCYTPNFSKGKKKDASFDNHIIGYNQSEAILAVTTIFMMVMSFSFSIYTFLNPRYMFKRTAGGLHFLSMGSTLTVIELVEHSLDYEKKNLPFVFPPGARSDYSYSFWIGWIVFAINLISGIFFMVYSRKRKGKKAPTEEMGLADEPIVIGR